MHLLISSTPATRSALSVILFTGCVSQLHDRRVNFNNRLVLQISFARLVVQFAGIVI